METGRAGGIFPGGEMNRVIFQDGLGFMIHLEKSRIRSGASPVILKLSDQTVYFVHICSDYGYNVRGGRFGDA
jgi:hypothetical protein